jgi:hypothetical protein
MIPQIDPSAIQQIDKGAQQRQGEQSTGDESRSSGDDVTSSLPAATVPAQQPMVGGPVVNAAPNIGPLDPGGRELTDTNVAPSPAPTAPVWKTRFDRTNPGTGPLPAPPAPPLPQAAPHGARKGGTMWAPVPMSASQEAEGTSIPGREDAALQPAPPPDSIRHPFVTGDQEITSPAGAPDVNLPDTTGTSGRQRPAPLDSEVPNERTELRLEPTPVDPNPIRGNREPSLPRPPALDALGPAVQHPTTGRRPRVDLAPDRPVSLDAAPVEPVSAGAGKPAGRVAEPTSADTPATVAAPVAEAGPASSGGVAGPTESQRPQVSALAERVIQAIDLQRNQPPPRSMVVDIPELEGLRLVVSVRAAGNVTVTPASGSANPDAFAPFTADLSRVLAERGFVMNGDGRKRGYNPYVDDDPVPTSRRPRGFRRPVRVDNDLRI